MFFLNTLGVCDIKSSANQLFIDGLRHILFCQFDYNLSCLLYVFDPILLQYIYSDDGLSILWGVMVTSHLSIRIMFLIGSKGRNSLTGHEWNRGELVVKPNKNKTKFRRNLNEKEFSYGSNVCTYSCFCQYGSPN